MSTMATVRDWCRLSMVCEIRTATLVNISSVCGRGVRSASVRTGCRRRAPRRITRRPFTRRPCDEHRLLIASLDPLSRNEELHDRLRASEFDLVVIDEAHRMPAHYFGSEVNLTKRYQLGQLLGGITRHLLLMTVTPHAGKGRGFPAIHGVARCRPVRGSQGWVHAADTSDLLRRMVKEHLVRFDGTPLVPYRLAKTGALPAVAARGATRPQGFDSLRRAELQGGDRNPKAPGGPGRAGASHWVGPQVVELRRLSTMRRRWVTQRGSAAS